MVFRAGETLASGGSGNSAAEGEAERRAERGVPIALDVVASAFASVVGPAIQQCWVVAVVVTAGAGRRRRFGDALCGRKVGGLKAREASCGWCR